MGKFCGYARNFPIVWRCPYSRAPVLPTTGTEHTALDQLHEANDVELFDLQAYASQNGHWHRTSPGNGSSLRAHEGRNHYLCLATHDEVRADPRILAERISGCTPTTSLGA